MTRRITAGLRFRTLRSIYWVIPAPSGANPIPDWRVPTGTHGKVHVNGFEVGFYFVGLQYPPIGPVPSRKKSGDEIPDWMEVL